MPIYSLHERVRYFKSIKTIDNTPVSYENGNMFESMAATNPELFDVYKLKQLEHSRDLVDAFNDYFYAITEMDGKKFDEFSEKYKDASDEEYNNYFYNNFNIAHYWMIMNDIYKLKNDYKLSDKQINDYVNKKYLPEGLSKSGIRKLIRVRLMNNELLIDSLTKMLQDNYALLDLSTAEAKAKIDSLHNDNTSNSTIGDIRNKFKNQSFLNKFKKGRNYDFRPIGGAYVFLADGIEFEGGAPHKYISNIFKYDAIVIGHGSNWKEERLYTISTLLQYKNTYIVDDIMKVFAAYFDKKDKVYKLASKETNSQMEDAKEYMSKYVGVSLSKNDMINISDKLRTLIDLLIDESEHSKNKDDKLELNSIARGFDYYMNAIYSKNNISSTIMDGKSADWVVDPINTITKKNLTHIIDILRTLKKEGFKNILLDVCNPGSIILPIDLRSSLNFNITMGLYSVLKEEVISENASDIFYSIKNIYDKCIDIFRSLSLKSKELINRRINGATDIPVRSVCIKDGKAIIKYAHCRDSSRVSEVVNDSNKSIMHMIEKISDDSYKTVKSSDFGMFDDINMI